MEMINIGINVLVVAVIVDTIAIRYDDDNCDIVSDDGNDYADADDADDDDADDDDDDDEEEEEEEEENGVIKAAKRRRRRWLWWWWWWWEEEEEGLVVVWWWWGGGVGRGGGRGADGKQNYMIIFISGNQPDAWSVAVVSRYSRICNLVCIPYQPYHKNATSGKFNKSLLN